MTGPDERRARFAALHRRGRPLFLPNAWDVASAVALVRAGHHVLGTTSLGVAAAAGLPDATGAARAETLLLAERLGRLPALLTVDVESGFSDDPADVAELAVQLVEAGAVGVNLEDGRPDGTLTAAAEHSAKIAAVRARAPELFVNARTDTFWLGSGGASLTDTLDRATAYLAAGADGVFVPGVVDLDRIATLADRIAAPLNVLHSPGRRLADLAAAGVARVSLGSLLFRAALGAAVAMADEISGRTPTGPAIPTYADVQQMIDPAR